MREVCQDFAVGAGGLLLLLLLAGSGAACAIGPAAAWTGGASMTSSAFGTTTRAVVPPVGFSGSSTEMPWRRAICAVLSRPSLPALTSVVTST